MHKYSTEIALINILAMAMASKHRIIETQVTTVTERISNLKSWQLYAYCLDTVSGAKTYSHTITAASEVNLRAAGTHNSHNVSLSVFMRSPNGHWPRKNPTQTRTHLDLFTTPSQYQF